MENKLFFFQKEEEAFKYSDNRQKTKNWTKGKFLR